jgi:pectate lyase
VAVGKGDDLGTTACTVPITIQGSKNRKGRAPEQVADSKNIWIDHNTFIRCGDKCITIKNGAKAPSGRFAGADNITLSHNRFQQSFFGVLITVINSDEGGARALVKRDTEKCAVVAASGVLPQTRVTIHGNLFEDVRRRMVRVAYCNSYGHEFNNAILGFGMPMSKYPAGATCDRSAFGFGPSAHSGGRLLLENNYIAAHPNDPNGCKAAVDTGGKGEDEGFVKDVGNLYANGATGGSNGAQHVAAPPYQYQMLPASQVLESVKRNAGARGR